MTSYATLTVQVRSLFKVVEKCVKVITIMNETKGCREIIFSLFAAMHNKVAKSQFRNDLRIISISQRSIIRSTS